MISLNNLISFVLMILSASMIALGSFVRKVFVGVDGIYLAMFICFVGSSILMWWIVSISSFTKIMPHGWKSIFIRVVFSMLAQVLLFVSLSRGSLLITMLLFNTSPLFIPVIRFVFFKKDISYFNFICIIVSFFGIYLILGRGSDSANIYTLSALCAGILNAASQVVLHNASQKEDVFIINLWIYTFIALVMIVLLPFDRSAVTDLNNLFTQPIIIWMSIAIIIFSISAQIFRVKAFKYTNDPALVAPAMYFSVIVAAILDIVFYNISMSCLEMCGILMICVASVLSLIKKA
ncbi:DMT family transporter [Francisella tularensis subsp. novicida]|uniref:DMT family transporter n=1 Tax=Francisella tularensis TaxID=263 RepID=UPI0008FD5C7A|nr:DMT family transporter [Francisella tularensis]APC96139.1 eamA-like transporter family protein [Francisella tularensis subsp. novicida]MBK2346319.1 DMT family transporter [Francisella tularensis subsp. novicida]